MDQCLSFHPLSSRNDTLQLNNERKLYFYLLGIFLFAAFPYDNTKTVSPEIEALKNNSLEQKTYTPQSANSLAFF